MTILTLTATVDRKAIADYCDANISPRRYYLHNKIGGEGWRIYSTLEPVNPQATWKVQHTKWYMEIDCEQQAILIRLRYGA